MFIRETVRTALLLCASASAVAAFAMPASAHVPGAASNKGHPAAQPRITATQIVNSGSGRCLDAEWESIDGNGTTVQLWDCLPVGNQLWIKENQPSSEAFRLRNAYSGRCLDADRESLGGNGTTVQLWDCLAVDNQLWIVEQSPNAGPSYRLRNVASGRYLDAESWSLDSDGTKVQLWDNAGGVNQSWQPLP
jgi:hypothetical protein